MKRVSAEDNDRLMKTISMATVRDRTGGHGIGLRDITTVAANILTQQLTTIRNRVSCILLLLNPCNELCHWDCLI